MEGKEIVTAENKEKDEKINELIKDILNVYSVYIALIINYILKLKEFEATASEIIEKALNGDEYSQRLDNISDIINFKDIIIQLIINNKGRLEIDNNHFKTMKENKITTEYPVESLFDDTSIYSDISTGIKIADESEAKEYKLRKQLLELINTVSDITVNNEFITYIVNNTGNTPPVLARNLLKEEVTEKLKKNEAMTELINISLNTFWNNYIHVETDRIFFNLINKIKEVYNKKHPDNVLPNLDIGDEE